MRLDLNASVGVNGPSQPANLCLLSGILVILVVTQAGCTRVSFAPPDPIADNLRLTSANGPLPVEAYKGHLSFAYEAPGKIRSGESALIHLLVKNESQLTWPYGGQPDGKYQISAGNHWLDQSGNTVDDARGALAYDLRPGDTAEVLIMVTAPVVRGSYTLEFDLVQEQVTWFSEKGSEPLRVKVLVE
jgi:hypothetical protein